MFLSHDVMASRPGQDDDYWFKPYGIMTASGMNVSPETAMRLSVAFACIKVLAEDVGQLPLHLYRQNGRSKERAIMHPLYRILHSRPNRWQTSVEWREMMQGHASLRGNAYSRIFTNPNGTIRELVPLHPDRVTPEITDENGGLRYRYKRLDGTEITLLSDEVFHLRGLSSDGFVGLNPIEQEREVIGMALAAQDYGSRFYQNGATMPGWIEMPGSFADKEARDKFRDTWQAAQTASNRFKTPVLEKGMQYHELSLKHTDLQYLETVKHTDIGVCRIFRMQPHKVGILDRATFNNIEQMALEHVTDTLMPWLVKWEQAISRDLLLESEADEHFVKFNVAGLLRGDSEARSKYYQNGIQDGWLVRNEARELEDLNPIEGLDQPLEPMNMAEPGNRGGRNNRQNEQGNARADQIRLKAAERVVNKELIAARKAWKKGPEAFADWLPEFYTSHAELVADAMAMPVDVADRYCHESVIQLGAAEDIEALFDEWEQTKAQRLAELEI